ncbi:hypothetical protein K474DRAFT_1658784 [Panus rudis PR-1116 ss-1]|nr:hypothetical protein K474DRAFT_1658784 [Panus rudis PR-1116 ss-1]
MSSELCASTREALSSAQTESHNASTSLEQVSTDAAAGNGTIAAITIPTQPQDSPKTAEGEEALEWHEVIELQAFSERKAWIEEKIKLLEQMPPVEVFAGLDAVRSSAVTMEGLPSREELEEWVAEHDRIEKETEIFDSGELKKLKKFTKAAAQRNLSPADTDLIELTLTTIYELDKLLHLLRDRSDNLELLGIRITWEERRISAWSELHKVIADIKDFLETRARWSPSVYDNLDITGKDDDPLQPITQSSASYPRRNSVVSIASAASDSSLSSVATLSRTARYRLSELLSRDAAQYASRVSSLKHSKINAAGKALDKLIDHSRGPVPDELLDEQDRLEDKGINEMDDVGKFIMNIVMQWKKADEYYVETTKDKAAAQSLAEEIETAILSHPTSRQDATFLSRVAALTKRLAMRGNPTSPSYSFPQPIHHLFPDQQSFNESTLRLLAAEFAAATEQVKKAEQAARQYHAAFEAVRKVEVICKAASDLSTHLISLINKLENGIETSNGDGTPPDLSSEDCLQANQHSVFLALLPSVLKEAQKAENDVDSLLKDAELAFSELAWPGIDPQFISHRRKDIDALASHKARVEQARQLVVKRSAILEEARDIWGVIERVHRVLDDIWFELADRIEYQAWKSHSSQDALPPTPESTASSLSSASTMLSDVSTRIEIADSCIRSDVEARLSRLSGSDISKLKSYLEASSLTLSSMLGGAKGLSTLLISVQEQSSAMIAAQEESNHLLMLVEELGVRYSAASQNALSGLLSGQELDATQRRLSTELAGLQASINAFIDRLPRRIPFLSNNKRHLVSTNAHGPRRRASAPVGFSLEVLQQSASRGIPLDLGSIDHAVRSDANAVSMFLSGRMEDLLQKSDHLRLAIIARAFDVALVSVMECLKGLNETMSFIEASVETHAGKESPDLLEELEALGNQADNLRDEALMTATTSLQPLQQLVRELGDSGMLDSATHESLLLPRSNALQDAENLLQGYAERLKSLQQRISHLKVAEFTRQEEEARKKEQERLARATAEFAEKERLAAAAETETLRAEQEAEAERLRTEAVRLEEDRARLTSEAETERRRLAELEQSIAESSKLSQRHSHGTFHDVFGSPTIARSPGQSYSDLQQLIYQLRKRLYALGIKDLARPSNNNVHALPSQDQATKLATQLAALSDEIKTIPSLEPENLSLDMELRSIRSEFDASEEQVALIQNLATLRDSIQTCDNALSDLLEHIDSYPSPPLGVLASAHKSDPSKTPEEQLSARLTFTQSLLNDTASKFAQVKNDARAVAEYERIQQTWTELRAMGMDRVNGQKSRPPSVISSGRSSRASVATPPVDKKAGYSKLSFGSPGGRFLAPPAPNARRSTSGGSTRESHTRSSSRMSAASTSRSVSGPTDISSRLHQSTFASRQRTSSITSNGSSSTTPLKRSLPIASRPRAQTNQTTRTSSPAFSDVSSISQSRSSLNLSRSTHSTWARAPRLSFPSVPLSPPPRKVQLRKPYVANPKSKLDIAVGDVVNKLPENVNINVEVVGDTWRDQSGKYWIGNQDPKLCFCRILRSQTVMVRVGGGWAELSKFIRDHFADAFRLLPDSPPRAKGREEKWISSTTLAAQAAMEESQPPAAPKTPEPISPFIPSFALSTPSGKSPQSMKTSPSPGSPLTALQFIRRADRESPLLRPETPTKPHRTVVVPSTPQRQPVWRP